MNYKEQYNKWLNAEIVPSSMKEEMKNMTEDDIKMAFSDYMSFGTAGLRSIMGPGPGRMNLFTVAHATQGVASLIISEGTEAMNRGVVIAYDSRNNSAEFAKRSAEVLSSNGIKAYLFPSLRPTPTLSFAIIELGCIAGLNITASHNPAEYNGYKAYWEDGAQLSPDHAKIVSNAIAEADIFTGVPSSENARPDLIQTVSSDVDDSYIENVLAQRININAIPSVADDLKIVYTPLHGAGSVMVPRVLELAGIKHLYTVKEQMEPDGNFPTLKNPNPEFKEAFDIGIVLANKEGSDLIIATDPDADRVGVMARNKKGEFKAISGNQMGCLLLDYIITAFNKEKIMPDEPYAVKSIVTSELASKICEANGVTMFNVLTGFKFIGEVIKQHEAAGHGYFLFGFEESYGYLKGTYARDKDAVVASLLICEMAAYYRLKGMTLCDALDELFERYGYYREHVFSISMDGADGKEKMDNLMAKLRENPPESINNRKIVLVKDFKNRTVTNLSDGSVSDTGLPSSDVLYYVTETNDVIVIRPSGTEPKVKVYVLTYGATEEEASLNVEGLTKCARIIMA